MRSVMRHQFSQVPRADIPRSSFDRSHGHKSSFHAGYLVPIYVDEALPGDTFNMSLTTFARLATPLHPIMDNMFCDVFFFAVPIRLIWDHFVNFFGEQRNPSDTTSYLVPTATSPSLDPADGVSVGYKFAGLQDYMGIPPGVVGLKHNVLPLRAYNLIWNEWFRDQNLQNSVPCPTDDGPDPAGNYKSLRRGKRHDYFTSALPWPQKGPAVQIPIGSKAPVLTQATNNPLAGYPALQWATTAGLAVTGAGGLAIQSGGSTILENIGTGSFGTLYPSNLYADLGAATAATINQLRQAFQVQKIYERDARGGTRYTELIQSHFGVTSPDARLQRPEYLGGGSAVINVNPIAQTSATGIQGSTTPQGNLTGTGTFSHKGVGFTKSFTEHCYIIGMLSARADITYQYGLNRMWSRQTRFDFYWPALAHIGEQAVLNKEIYAKAVPADDLVFGYQERYAEYRYKPSIISSIFRSDYSLTLDSWHLADKYTTLPLLNAAFIEDNPPISRVLAVSDQAHFLLDCYFNLKCARPMPLYGVPGNIDRF